MEGSLGEDVLNLENYIINGVDFDLKLYPARSAFSLMSDTPAKEYNLIIETAILKMCTVDVGDTIVSAHNHSLEREGIFHPIQPEQLLSFNGTKELFSDNISREHSTQNCCGFCELRSIQWILWLKSISLLTLLCK